jgi:N-hydroxyarylamine O-acetyltransferase
MGEIEAMDAGQLAAYLARIHYDGPLPLTPSLPVLTALHRGHAYHIPYELLDWMVAPDKGGRRVSERETVPCSYALSVIHHKLVTQRRGGACVYHNLLLAAALKAIGFAGVQGLGAIGQLESRMARWAPGTPLPAEGHLVLTVLCDARVYLCDLGSPLDGLSTPVRVVLDQVQPSTAHASFALRAMPEDPRYIELRILRNLKWTRTLAFQPAVPRTGGAVLGPALAAIDAVPLLHNIVLVQPHPEGWDQLVDRRLRRRRGTVTTTTTIGSAQEYERLLREAFGVDFRIDTLMPFARALLDFPSARL